MCLFLHVHSIKIMVGIQSFDLNVLLEVFRFLIQRRWWVSMVRLNCLTGHQIEFRTSLKLECTLMSFKKSFTWKFFGLENFNSSRTKDKVNNVNECGTRNSGKSILIKQNIWDPELYLQSYVQPAVINWYTKNKVDELIITNDNYLIKSTPQPLA